MNNELAAIEGVIPTATLITGVNQPDHVSQFNALIHLIRYERNMCNEGAMHFVKGIRLPHFTNCLHCFAHVKIGILKKYI